MKLYSLFAAVCVAAVLVAGGGHAPDKEGGEPEEKAGPKDNTPPKGFTLLFNGKNLDGWQGLVELPQREKLQGDDLTRKQKEANEKYLPHWTVKNGILHYDGKGQSLQSAKDYGNFE